MTAREIDMLKDFLSREIEALTLALREMREEASVDHRNVRKEMKTLADRLEIVEDTESITRSREEFRKSLRSDVMKLAAGLVTAAAALTAITFQLIDRL